MCVRERERQREREQKKKERWRKKKRDGDRVCVCVCVCVVHAARFILGKDKLTSNPHSISNIVISQLTLL